MNWEENRELGVVRLHIFNSRISNSRKIPGPKKRELGGHTVLILITQLFNINTTVKPFTYDVNRNALSVCNFLTN